MKSRRIIRIAVLVVVLLLAGHIAQAQSPDTPSVAAPVSMFGGGYVLVSQPSSANGALRGGHYQLAPSMPAVDPAPGCCCKTNLPCVLRQ
jgi:hypothetical protein